MLLQICCAYHTTSGTMHPVPISRERWGGNCNKPATYKVIVPGACHKLLLPLYHCMISTGGANGTIIYVSDFAAFI